MTAKLRPHATEEITCIEAEIDFNENAKLLMSMTGIETFAAMLLVSEIGDITRFKTADRLVSWTGMCPRVYQSGNVTHYGRMKKASNRSKLDNDPGRQRGGAPM